jgi:hypothetical protein
MCEVGEDGWNETWGERHHDLLSKCQKLCKPEEGSRLLNFVI